jgi:pentatricopeptide repeat protein
MSFKGAGRAITQANQSAANDSGYSQNDDNDEVHLSSGTSRVSRKVRVRSNSLVLTSQGKNERADKLGVLKVVQMHARASHAFSPNKIDEAGSFDPVESVTSRPVLVRRNSTSTASPSFGNPDIPPPVSHTHRDVDPSDPAAPQSITPPFEENIKDTLSIREVLQSFLPRTRDDVFLYVKQILDSNRLPADIDVYDLALEALSNNRKIGVQTDLFIRLYDDLIKRGLVGTVRTYTFLIKALGNRDQDVHDVISTIQARIKRRENGERAVGRQHEFDLNHIAKLRGENNFSPAISLFQSALAAGLTVSQSVLTTLIRSCALHLDEYAALRVFAYLEKRYADRIPISAFYHMLSLYGNLRNVEGAVEVFQEYKKASQELRVIPDNQDEEDAQFSSDDIYVSRYVSPWNKMTEIYFKSGRPTEALSLLEEMMDSKGLNPIVPLPTASTFHTVISGFCQSGDVSTGLLWFRRLLQEDYVTSDPHEPVSKPPRPNLQMWRYMTEFLVEHGMIPDLNEIFSSWLDIEVQDKARIGPVDRLSVLEANLKYVDAHPELNREEAFSQLDFLLERVIGEAKHWAALGMQDTRLCGKIIQLYERYDGLAEATDTLCSFAEAQKTIVTVPEAGVEIEANRMRMITSLRSLVIEVTKRMIFRSDKKFSFALATKMVALLHDVGIFPTVAIADAYFALYEEAKEKGEVGHLAQQDVEYLIGAAVTLCYIKPGNEAVESGRTLARLASLLDDVTLHIPEPSSLSITTLEGIIRALLSWYPESALPDFFNRLGTNWQGVWNHTKVQRAFSRIVTNMDEKISIPELVTGAPIITQPGSDMGNFKISGPLSQSIDEVLPNYGQSSANKAYNMFMIAFQKRVYPHLDTLGRLINALGRGQELKKARFVYDAAQHVLSIREMETASSQSAAWFQVEDQMIIALAHAGDIEGAHAHRLRMLEYGGTPSADGYGALIRCVKDTTDDSANAYSLFRESQIRGVVPNVYLYNTMISKLAKARKADYAMELFHKMRANGFWPSSVSYGSVIGACCRVGDHQSAELLFQEMSVQPNFRPRIPPYNTMMQLYAYTKPNRERVLHYYNALLEAQVKPTAHTYKVREYNMFSFVSLNFIYY